MIRLRRSSCLVILLGESDVRLAESVDLSQPIVCDVAVIDEIVESDKVPAAGGDDKDIVIAPIHKHIEQVQ